MDKKHRDLLLLREKIKNIYNALEVTEDESSELTEEQKREIQIKLQEVYAEFEKFEKKHPELYHQLFE
jgi:hypothetical protein